ncbi:MAG: hypothetical protein RH946_16010 [Rhodospirillales bacterium]
MTGKLRKLEAADGIEGYVHGYSLDYEQRDSSVAAARTGMARRKARKDDTMKIMSVPRDGWLSGPGRGFSFG